MLNKHDLIIREQKTLESFFNTRFMAVPSLPDWVTDELLHYWDENIFHVHYVPKISLDEDLDLPAWKSKPSKTFYKKIREEKLSNEAKVLPGKWLLIDGRDKPTKKVPWIRVKDVWLLQKLGFRPKDYLQKWDKQLHQNEYLLSALIERGFGSRFCLDIDEIHGLMPFILEFLKTDSQKTIRLPSFAEYNYFGNAIYRQWQTTETWEWFEDRLDNGHYLAGGSRNVGCMGWEPPEFWSTILTFRPVIEL